MLLTKDTWKRITSGTFAAGAAVTLLAAPMFAQDKADAPAPPPGAIQFVGKNVVATANGTFKQWKFTKAEFDPANPEKGEVIVEVDLASIDTGIVKRDDHLRTADFFDVEKYPKAVLKIGGIKPDGKDEAGHPQFAATLSWSMHGIEKNYDTFKFSVISSDPIKVKGRFVINRMDFKIGEPHHTLNPMSIREEIPITFEATLPG